MFQGDHGGVEYATQAHEQLLGRRGLLSARTRVVSSRPAPPGPLHDALIIDDYFAISAEKVTDFQDLSGDALSEALRKTAAGQCISQAKAAYSSASLRGSDAKDNLGALRYTVAGAQIDSSLENLKAGQVLAGAPLHKRLSLSYLSLQAAALPAITEELAAIFAGSRVSFLQFRKCLSCALDKFFRLGRPSGTAPGSNLQPLPRKAAEELCLLAALAPIICADLAVPYDENVYCTDASLQEGAVCRAHIGADVSELLWLSAGRKAPHAPLCSSHAREQPLHLPADDHPPPQSPPKELGLDYDFIEVYGGSGKVSRAVSRLGWRPGPCIDLSSSEEFDMKKLHVLDWILYMILHGRLRSLMLEVPCTTFTTAAWPAVRSHALPLGFDRRLPKTWLGNFLAFRALIIFRLCLSLGVACLIENPRRSKFFWLPAVKALLRKPEVRYDWLASCAYGSPHKKEFGFLSCHAETAQLHRKCPGGHSHLPVQGKHAKASAIYHDTVALALGSVFDRALKALPPPPAPEAEGLEGLVVNDILASTEWEVASSWTWKSPRHINVLESDSGLALYKKACPRERRPAIRRHH